MLFNSYEFLFGFLPVTIIGFILFERVNGRAKYLFLLLASIFFYAWWDVRFVPLLIGSFTVNYVGGHLIYASRTRGKVRHTPWLVGFFVALNLVLLGIFKYAHFFAQNVGFLLGTNFDLGNIILPLGISFFTFEQITFLVDVGGGRTRPRELLYYALFVSFFPRLVAGPILRYDEIVPQMATNRRWEHTYDDLATGLTIFSIGLVKKALLADGIAPYASPVFAAAAKGGHIDFLLAWGGVLAYTCQLYFDFSGYSDMAIGAARCFGIRFPMNFFSPYKAKNVIDFWRRWHMTLSRFLRDYLYIPLGGNRRGRLRRYINLMITMLLGGLWHGANWTFIAWGGLHGIYLTINHGWIGLAERHEPLRSFRSSRVGAICGLTLTFVAVAMAWAFFRAPTFSAAFDLVEGMAGWHGVVIPVGLEFALQPVRSVLDMIGVRFAEESGTILIKTYLWILALLTIAFFLPSTQELMVNAEPVIEMKRGPKGFLLEGYRWLRWSPSPVWAITMAGVAFAGLISITHVSEFLYWQF